MRLTRFLTASSATILALIFSAACSFAETVGGGVVEIFISVPDQSLAVLRDGELLGKFRAPAA